MTLGAGTSLDALSQRLGYAFTRPELLRRALTHASARTAPSVTRDNERLEFLGDRVLGLCVAEMLLQAFPEAPEGELARRFNRLVCKETCAAVGLQDLDLGRFMIMSGGEALGGGRRKQSILGNACEAVLGAVFLDGGFDVVRAVVRKFWEPRLAEGDAAPPDAKTALQEWAQARGLALPVYAEVARSGPDHAPSFTTQVEVEGLAPSVGKGASKRIAEQAAARAMLIRQGVWSRGHGD